MNFFDYLFQNSNRLTKDFIQGPRETISYDQLYTRSLILAGYLNDTLGQGQNILLIAPNSIFFIIAYLGILKSGNVAVPLSTEIEQANLDYILEKCQAPLAIATAQAAGKLQFMQSRVMDEKMLNELCEKGTADKAFPGEFKEEQLAEIIFTSGSTGEP